VTQQQRDVLCGRRGGLVRRRRRERAPEDVAGDRAEGVAVAEVVGAGRGGAGREDRGEGADLVCVCVCVCVGGGGSGSRIKGVADGMRG
jgi:hypothetical protein